VTGLREVEPGEWDDLLEGLGLDDGYLRRAAVEAASLLEPSRPVFLGLAGPDGHVVLSLLVREIPDGNGLLDAVAPYPYGGPLAAGASPPVAGFHEAYEEWCTANGIVTTFMRFHPRYGNQVLAPPGAVLERLADAATWRLEGDLFAGMHRSHRNKCRKAGGAGVEVTVDVAPERLDGFLALHAETMGRVGASTFYYFGPEYWETLRSGLGERLVRLDARLKNELVASEICVAGGGWLHYHMGVTSDAGRSLGAANLLVYETAVWARDRGFVELSLGSGLAGREDSLWAFKQRFSPHEGREYWIGKLVHDEAAYVRLAGAAGADGFFPAYRAPAVVGRYRLRAP
jgi:hypothetical protein